MAISVSFPFSWCCSTGGLVTHSAGCWLPLVHLVTNFSDLQLTDFLSSPSYIIIQSPTQSSEWHVWSSSSGNNCHAVHRSLSSGASVYACTMGYYLVPYCQPSPPTQFLLITAIGMCHFLPVHHFRMACLAGSKVNIQHKKLFYIKDQIAILLYTCLYIHKTDWTSFLLTVYLQCYEFCWVNAIMETQNHKIFLFE